MPACSVRLRIVAATYWAYCPKHQAASALAGPEKISLAAPDLGGIMRAYARRGGIMTSSGGQAVPALADDLASPSFEPENDWSVGRAEAAFFSEYKGLGEDFDHAQDQGVAGDFEKGGFGDVGAEVYCRAGHDVFGEGLDFGD